jgi:hypothetical protein
MMFNRLLRCWLLIALAAVVPLAHAAPIPPGWDLTFKEQRAEEPPIRRGINDTFNLYREIDQRGRQMRYMLQQVPLDSVDAAVFVQEYLRSRYGVFIQGERAYLVWQRDYKFFNLREVHAADARRIIEAYMGHSGPTTRLFGDGFSHSCLSTEAHSVVSVYASGKAKQYWLSGADYCELQTEVLAPLKVFLCGGHCHASKVVDRWASKLYEDLLKLPPVRQNSAALVQAFIRKGKCEPPGPDIAAAVEPNGRLEDGQGLLRWALAAKEGRCAVGWLLRNGADPEARDYYGHRAGAVAAKVASGELTGDRAVLKALALQDVADVLQSGGTPAAMCQELNGLMGVRRASESTAGSGDDRDIYDAEVTAATLSLLEKLDTGCTSSTGAPLLEMFVRGSSISVIELALRRGFPVNQYHYGTPLDAAFFEKRADVHELLVRAGGKRSASLQE